MIQLDAFMKRISILLLSLVSSCVLAQDTEDIFELSPFCIEEGSALPAVTLKKKADNLLLSISLINDSREGAMRRSEILQTLEGMIEDSAKYADLSILSDRKPVTMENLNSVEITAFYGKTDTSVCNLLLKVPLGPDQDAESRIELLESFSEQIKVDGRTIVESGAIGLSVENPQQYRNKIISLIAEDYKYILETFDERFQILVHNLNQRVQWQRSSVSELDLYIDYEYEILAKDTQSLKVKTVEEY